MLDGADREKLKPLIEQLNAVRSTVAVASAALWAGDTDLELHSSRTLKDAADALEKIDDELSSLHIDTSESTEERSIDLSATSRRASSSGAVVHEVLAGKAILEMYIDSIPDARADDRFVLWAALRHFDEACSMV